MNSYAKEILYELLKLRKGDALSINTEESDFEIAKVFASEALLISDVTVKVVITENGRPLDVMEFEPTMPGRTKSCGFALLRIAHSNDVSVTEDEVLLDNYPEKDDFVSIQKLHHLAEPVVLNRRLSIPYCVVSAASFASDSVTESFSDRILVIDYRKKFLNHLDIDKLHFVGNDCNFTVAVSSYGAFNSNHIFLSNGRDFVCSPDFEKITALLDKDSIDGKVSALTEIFGRKQKIIFKYESGKLIDCTDSKQLKKLISYSYDVVKPGFVAMADKCFELHLGGALIENFIKEPEDENSFPDSFNSCLYCLKLDLSQDLNIFYSGCDGIEHELVRKGFFLD